MRLNTQISEYDCAPTSLLNALKYLYKKDEIPIDILKIVYTNTLDCKNKIIGDCGTSRKAMKKICKKINHYSQRKNYGLNFKYLDKDNFNIQSIKKCINNNGVVIVRSWLELEHYYLLTDIDSKKVYVWDPYIDIQIEDNYNIIIDRDTLETEEEINYSLGPIKKREIILITKDC